jgi:hypothetical protein
MRVSDTRISSSAASVLKNACLTWSVTWNCWFVRLASALVVRVGRPVLGATGGTHRRCRSRRSTPCCSLQAGLVGDAVAVDPRRRLIAVQELLALTRGATSRAPRGSPRSRPTAPRACTAGCTRSPRPMASSRVTVASEPERARNPQKGHGPCQLQLTASHDAPRFRAARAESVRWMAPTVPGGRVEQVEMFRRIAVRIESVRGWGLPHGGHRVLVALHDPGDTVALHKGDGSRPNRSA